MDAEIFFSVDEDVGYALSGGYALADPFGDFASFGVRLEDVASGTILFRFSRVAASEPDPAFDLTSPNEGSPTGTLVAGREYRLFLDALSSVGPFPMNATGFVAVGTGSVTLQLVPEPSLAVLVCFGLAAIARRRL